MQIVITKSNVAKQKLDKTDFKSKTIIRENKILYIDKNINLSRSYN